MDVTPLENVIRNIDARLERVEQILPTLSSKEELRDAVRRLATKEELREEGDRTRRHFDAVAERIEGHVRLLAETQVAHRETCDKEFDNVQSALSAVDRRLTRLETRKRR